MLLLFSSKKNQKEFFQTKRIFLYLHKNNATGTHWRDALSLFLQL